jgi:membrane protein implicated in regulation of membrane protease activity
MFDTLMYLLLFLPAGFPVVPWLFRTRSGRWGIWLSTGFVILTLLLFPFLFFSACAAVNCGQGAIAIFMLGPVWIASAMFTVASAAIASYSLRQRGGRR